MPEGDSIENRKQNPYNIDKFGAKQKEHPVNVYWLLFLWCIHLNSWIRNNCREIEIKNNSKKQYAIITPI